MGNWLNSETLPSSQSCLKLLHALHVPRPPQPWQRWLHGYCLISFCGALGDRALPSQSCCLSLSIATQITAVRVYSCPAQAGIRVRRSDVTRRVGDGAYAPPGEAEARCGRGSAKSPSSDSSIRRFRGRASGAKRTPLAVAPSDRSNYPTSQFCKFC